MRFFEEIQKNSSLRFIDDNNSSNLFTLEQLPLIHFPDNTKKLAFLYLDNSLKSITTLLSFMRSNHSIALLSSSLTLHFKEELEALYKPFYIADPSRTTVNSYWFDSSSGLFNCTEEVSYDIHPDIKVLLSTSGTTGSPKFVKLSENNIISNALSICAYLPIQHSDVTPLNLPVYYSYGLSVLTSNCLKGGTIVCSNTDVLNKDFWIKMEQYGYTSIAGVPFVYEMLDRIGFTRKKYPSLRYFTQAGGKLQESLVRKFADYAIQNSIEFYVMYGQTEATARMSYLPPDNLTDKIGSIGIAIPGGTFSIDEDTSELCYSGPNVFGGYVLGPDDLGSYEQLKQLNTGDLARKDADGFYYITGRMKRFVKLFGNRINLDEVESLLAKQFNPGLKSVGVNDKLLLIVYTDADFMIQEVVDFTVKELKLHPTVVKTLYINEYPLTANGKIDYNKILEQYATA